MDHPLKRFSREALTVRLVEANVPFHLHEGLTEYIVTGRPTGHFLYAVLTNDLADACNRADDVNRYRLFDVVYFLTNYAPGGCWRSAANVDAWRAHRGIEGLPT